ncbi:MAG: DUF3592 domain-containing protein [Bradyrhizobium sp.]|uniref:DUF3592 domain-containing protein n=1 Tax=Bradyrhizobium sp. TaxID=376 RepID=UPI002731ABF7|nr:DUF3592 domain-containing protein [Bradyrhizobium sp.]MDP1867230.1 DUF3592 domain-containing protein [Bradyrhizobium sp.]
MPDLPWFVYAMLLAPLGLILVAATYKTLQVRAAREWPSTPGKVVVSTSQLRDVRVLDSARENGHRIEQRNFANIGVHGSFSSNSRTTSRWMLRLFGMDFQDGASVEVWVNPVNPSEATLNPRAPFGWLPWLLAAGLWTVAYLIAAAG